TNAPDYAYNYNGQGLSKILSVPKFRGANMSDPAQVELYNPVDVRDAQGASIGILSGLPVLESSNNEAYGATGQGLRLQRNQGHANSNRRDGDEISLFKAYRSWHVTEAGVDHWGEDRLSHFEGFRIYNDPNISAQS